MTEKQALLSGKSRKNDSNLKIPSRWIFRACLILAAALAVVFLLLGINRMRSSYNSALGNAYSAAYNAAFQFAEKQSHVSNYVTIAIKAEQEISRLEVLKVSDSEFVVKNAEKDDSTTSWLEVQGTGIFTVDLNAAEFIADSDRKYVLVNIPNPVLTSFEISRTEKQFWHSSNSPLANGSVAGGVQLAQEQLAEGQQELEDSMRQSRKFHEAAKNAAVMMIESIVRSWNPDISGLQVEVKFIETM